MRSIYCSGSIAKGPEDEKKLCWTDDARARVEHGTNANVAFFNPDDPIPDAKNVLGQFGRDIYQVMSATAVVVDGRERRGLGVGVEMAAAAAMNVPIIFVIPRNTKYRMDILEYRGVVVEDYVHPHIAALAYAVVETFEAAGEVLATLTAAVPSRRGSVPSWLEAALLEYEQKMLPIDSYMRAALDLQKQE